MYDEKTNDVIPKYVSKYEKAKYPEPKKNILKWKSRGRTEPALFVIYADFELRLTPFEIDGNLTGHIHVVDQRVPSIFYVYTVGRYNEIDDEPFMSSGPHCMEIFFDRRIS
jgi:hypothetical protein